MSEERICTQCLSEPALTTHTWCRRCRRLYQRRWYHEQRYRLTPEAIAAEKERKREITESTASIGSLLGLLLTEKELPSSSKPEKGLRRQIGARLISLRALCTRKGEFGSELEFLGLSRSLAKYYRDRFLLSEERISLKGTTEVL